MSHSPRAVYNCPQNSDTTTKLTEAERVEAVLGALEDADCRAILEAASDEALTAGELSERLGLAQSTAYRKLETLTDAGLLDEQIRLSRSGKHTSEYSRAVDGIELSMHADGIELVISHCQSASAQTPMLAGAD